MMAKGKLHLDRVSACALLRNLDIPRDADFFELRSSKVDELLNAANRYGYRKPKSASGSRGRYFFEFVKRTCR